MNSGFPHSRGLDFVGWTREGYWLNGELTRAKQYTLRTAQEARQATQAQILPIPRLYDLKVL